MSPSLANLVAALRSEGYPALADEITLMEHNAHRYVAMRWCYLVDHDVLTPKHFNRHDDAADECVHRFEESKN